MIVNVTPLKNRRLAVTRIFFAGTLLSGLFLLTACFPGVYRLDIPQGNVLEKEKIDQLKIGMTKRQVRFVLGTPLIVDSFNQDRWDYFYSVKYYLKKDNSPQLYRAHLTLVFEKGQLAEIKKDIPEEAQPNPAAVAAGMPEPEVSDQETPDSTAAEPKPAPQPQ